MGSETKRASDAEIREWVERHDLRVSSATDARAAFEDAQTAHFSAPTPPDRAAGREGDKDQAAATILAHTLIADDGDASQHEVVWLARAYLALRNQERDVVREAWDAGHAAALRARALPPDIGNVDGTPNWMCPCGHRVPVGMGCGHCGVTTHTIPPVSTALPPEVEAAVKQSVEDAWSALDRAVCRDARFKDDDVVKHQMDLLSATLASLAHLSPEAPNAGA